MNSHLPVKNQNGHFSRAGLSIQQRLPLRMCLLLVFTVLALGWLSQLGVKKTAMAMGKERLEGLTKQLGTLFGQSAAIAKTMTRTAAAQETFRLYLHAGTKIADTSVIRLLDKLRPDSTWVRAEIFDARMQPVIHSAPAGSAMVLNTGQALATGTPAPDSARVGQFYLSGKSIYFPVIAAITDSHRVTGYLVRWRLQTATPAALAQFSQLLGTNATLYLGNSDGSRWTDMMQSAPSPPGDMNSQQVFFEYARPGKDPVMAATASIPNTSWRLLIEFSQRAMMESSRRFLPWVFVIGAVIVLAGIGLAWGTSRSITSPLSRLTEAARAMAAGNYGVRVDGYRQDELGELAHAFNAMSARVGTAQQVLEQAVQERTMELHAANKELEAFSYSVSHDLRSPLRAINGYACILEEDYSEVLDAEGQRVTAKIISNAKSMGQLIDDLIAFSQISKRALKLQLINMNALVAVCLEELLQDLPQDKYEIKLDPLPACTGDPALVKQVWMNLVSNAIKYSAGNKAPRIEIGWDQARTPASWFVRDNGVGFDMKYAGKLFGVFQRLHTREEFEGTGIGLSFVKRILNRHHGAISVEASPGKGAAFYFSMP